MIKRTFRAYSLFLFPIYFAFFFFIGIALTTPMGKIQHIDILDSTPSFTKTSSQASILNDCSNVGGVFVSKGADSYVVFDCSRYNITAISTSFVAKNTDAKLTLYYDTGASFAESQTVKFYVSKNNPYVFSRLGEKIYRIRYDFKKKLQIEKIDFYENCVTTYKDPITSSSQLPAVIAVSIILSLIVTVIEGKTNAVARMLGAVKRNAKSILLFIIILTSAAILAVLIAYLFSLKNGQISIYVFAFIFAAIAVVFEILFFSNTAGEKTEKLFLAVCLTIGLMMIVVTPVGLASWDTDTHYRYALATTSSTTVYTQADGTVFSAEQNALVSSNLKDNNHRYDMLNYEEAFTAGEMKFSLHLPHICSGIALKLAKYLACPFVVSFMIGKIPTLLIYAFVCYYAIKKLNSGKMLLSVIALFPTSLFLASNYSQDYWVAAFSFLGISYYYSLMQMPKLAITKKDTYIMYGAFFMACIPKPIYFTLLFIPLFMPAGKIQNKVRYYSIRIIVLAILIGMVYIKAQSSLSGTGDMRGGMMINPSEQLSGIFANPAAYISMLVNFLKNYLSPRNMNQYISLMGHLGIGSKAIVYIVLIVILGIIDKNKFDAETSKLRHKIMSVAVLIGTAAMIATALYIDYTPVGLDTIEGCQPRYLIPIIFPVCYTVGSFKKNIKISKNARSFINTVAFSACCYAALSDIYTTALTKMM